MSGPEAVDTPQIGDEQTFVEKIPRFVHLGATTEEASPVVGGESDEAFADFEPLTELDTRTL